MGFLWSDRFPPVDPFWMSSDVSRVQWSFRKPRPGELVEPDVVRASEHMVSLEERSGGRQGRRNILVVFVDAAVFIVTAEQEANPTMC